MSGVVSDSTPVNATVKGKSDFSKRLNRRKSVDSTNVLDTNLRRCLTTFDVTLLAVGHMIGSGVYVITSTVAKNIAGPAIIISFLLSGIAAFLSALCYAELGVLFPKAGSAYSYTYLAVGELWAFIVGWNMAFEYVIGAAATARACSSYIDSLTGDTIKTAIANNTEALSQVFSTDHLDFFAFALLKIIVIFLSFGVRITSYVNNFLSIVNLGIVAILIGVGSYCADISNWTNPKTGGFMPYGWSGVLTASASCFYAFIGFDSIAAAGEEVNMPQKAIPTATMISMGVSTFCYLGVSSVLTLMVNYKDISEESGLPDALGLHGIEWAKILVVVGAVSGMLTVIVGSIFSLTRVIYCMAEDGLLFVFCSKVSPRTKTPLRTMYLFSFLASILALVMDINSLVEIMSIGALIAYMVVSISVIVLRYSPIRVIKYGVEESETIEEDRQMSLNEDPAGRLKINFQFLRKFKLFPNQMWKRALQFYVAQSIVLCGFTKGCFDWIFNGHWWAVLIFVCLVIGVVLSFLALLMHQQTNSTYRYKVPLVPLVPALSIFINITFIVNLHLITWVRLLIWMVIGLSIYFSYGMEHSKLDIVMRSQKSWTGDVSGRPRKMKIFNKRASAASATSQQCLVNHEEIEP